MIKELHFFTRCSFNFELTLRSQNIEQARALTINALHIFQTDIYRDAILPEINGRASATVSQNNASAGNVACDIPLQRTIPLKAKAESSSTILICIW